MSPECKKWSNATNMNKNNPKVWNNIMKEREGQRPITKFCAEIFHKQTQMRKVAMIEHPVTSKMWSEPETRSLNAEDVDIDACAFNEDPDQPEMEIIKKPTKIKTTHPYVFPTYKENGCPNVYRCKKDRHAHKQSLGTQELTEAENYSIPVATMLADALCLAMDRRR